MTYAGETFPCRFRACLVRKERRPADFCRSREASGEERAIFAGGKRHPVRKERFLQEARGIR